MPDISKEFSDPLDTLIVFKALIQLSKVEIISKSKVYSQGTASLFEVKSLFYQSLE